MYDYAVIGGGIVGLSTGLALQRMHPEAKILLLEKETGWGQHQTGHNSGIIHSGIYYKPGSLKARLGREGSQSMVRFAQEHGIAYEICGKVVVATEPEELPRLQALYERGVANGLDVELIGKDRLKELEPHVSGLKAIRVPTTGIIDYRQVCSTMARLLLDHGSTMRTGVRADRIREGADGVEIETNSEEFQARLLINCAGLQSDRVAKAAGQNLDLQIIPFKGEYYELKPERRHLVKSLIYPVPDPAFPFLGVHFTRMIGAHVEAGPNAVLGLKREGYGRFEVDLKDTLDTLRFPGFWKFARKYWREGAQEMVRSFSKAAFVRSLQRLIPEIQADDLEWAPAGVRAQALRADGSFVDDFQIIHGRHSVHVCNAPSPAATASLEIGKEIVERLRLPTGVR